MAAQAACNVSLPDQPMVSCAAAATVVSLLAIAICGCRQMHRRDLDYGSASDHLYFACRIVAFTAVNLSWHQRLSAGSC